MRLLLDLYLDYAPDDHARQVLSDVQRMLGLSQYSLVDPAGAQAGQRRWQQQHDHLAGLRADELDAALHLGLAEHRRRHRRWTDGSCPPRSPAPGRAPHPTSATGARPGAQRTVWPPEP